MGDRGWEYAEGTENEWETGDYDFYENRSRYIRCVDNSWFCVSLSQLLPRLKTGRAENCHLKRNPNMKLTLIIFGIIAIVCVALQIVSKISAKREKAR